MVIRIILLILGFTIVVNLVLTAVSLIGWVNLYKKYGKQILNFFIAFALFIVALYVIFAFMGLFK